MTQSKIEKLMLDFETYVKTNLPTLLTRANTGATAAAPAFKTIELTNTLSPQDLPGAMIVLDRTDQEDAGPGAQRVTAYVEIIAGVSASKPSLLETYLLRYLDAIVDLGAYDRDMSGTDWEITVTGTDKASDGRGQSGWVSVTFEITGEVLYTQG